MTKFKQPLNFHGCSFFTKVSCHSVDLNSQLFSVGILLESQFLLIAVTLMFTEDECP